MRKCGVEATLDFIFAYEFRLADQIVDEKSLYCTWGKECLTRLMACSKEFDSGHSSCRAIPSIGPALHTQTAA